MEYTNSPLVSYTKLSLLTSGQRKHVIDRITPHCYCGQVTVQQMGEWFYNNSRSASCNYGIALDGQVGLFVEEKNRSYCSSSPENDNRAVTIECASDLYSPYAFRDVVYQRLIELCIDICRRNGKSKLLWFAKKQDRLGCNPAEDEMVLTMHRDLFDTDCPGQWMVDHMGDLAEKVTAALAEDTNVPITEEVATDTNVEDAAEAPVNETEIHGLQAKDLAALTNVQIVDTIGPLCTEDQKRTGILASVTMAQFILESGYSRTELAKNANNCFGMKKILSGNDWSGSVWDGESVYRMATNEYNPDGSQFTIVEYFRKYSCIEDSIADHSAYLLGAKKDDGLRYVGLKNCTDYRTAAQIIKDGGYATAPDYVSVLCQIIEMWGLTKWDYKEPDVPETNVGKSFLNEADYNQLIAWLSDITEWLKYKKK